MQCLLGCNRMGLLSPGKVNKRRQQGECLVLPACGGGPTHKLKVFTEPAAFGLTFYTPLFVNCTERNQNCMYLCKETTGDLTQRRGKKIREKKKKGNGLKNKQHSGSYSPEGLRTRHPAGMAPSRPPLWPPGRLPAPHNCHAPHLRVLPRRSGGLRGRQEPSLRQPGLC